MSNYLFKTHRCQKEQLKGPLCLGLSHRTSLPARSREGWAAARAQSGAEPASSMGWVSAVATGPPGHRATGPGRGTQSWGEDPARFLVPTKSVGSRTVLEAWFKSESCIVFHWKEFQEGIIPKFKKEVSCLEWFPPRNKNISSIPITNTTLSCSLLRRVLTRSAYGSILLDFDFRGLEYACIFR